MYLLNKNVFKSYAIALLISGIKTFNDFLSSARTFNVVTSINSVQHNIHKTKIQK